jgi:hypothetical protein
MREACRRGQHGGDKLKALRRAEVPRPAPNSGNECAGCSPLVAGIHKNCMRMNALASASIASAVPTRMTIGRESLACLRSAISAAAPCRRYPSGNPFAPCQAKLGGSSSATSPAARPRLGGRSACRPCGRPDGRLVRQMIGVQLGLVVAVDRLAIDEQVAATMAADVAHVTGSNVSRLRGVMLPAAAFS